MTVRPAFNPTQGTPADLPSQGNIGVMPSEAHRLDSEYSASLMLRKLNPHESLETL